MGSNTSGGNAGPVAGPAAFRPIAESALYFISLFGVDGVLAICLDDSKRLFIGLKDIARLKFKALNPPHLLYLVHGAIFDGFGFRRFGQVAVCQGRDVLFDFAEVYLVVARHHHRGASCIVF